MSGICDKCKRMECYMQHDGDDSCPLYLNGRQSNYKRLFGTPERAARTIADSCRENDYECGGCPAVEAYCRNGDYGALLEWLRGDA